jgi:hypothetical protein
MKGLLFQLIVVSILIMVTSPIFGENYTMTFDTTPVAFQEGYGSGQPYIEGDYSLMTTDIGINSGSIIRFNPFTQHARVPNNGTIYMGVSLFAHPVLQRIDGGAFNLIGLDVAHYSEYGMSTEAVSLTGYLESGSTLTQSLPLPTGSLDFYHYNLNWNNLTCVKFNNDGFGMDNIQISSIPEPATLLLLGLGGLFLRRKR